MSKKETAVEWLNSNLIHAPYTQEDFTHNYNMFEQAKGMEKEQIKDAFDNGYSYDLFNGGGKQYYEETYGDPSDHYYQNIYGTDQSIEKSTD